MIQLALLHNLLIWLVWKKKIYFRIISIVKGKLVNDVFVLRGKIILLSSKVIILILMKTEENWSEKQFALSRSPWHLHWIVRDGLLSFYPKKLIELLCFSICFRNRYDLVIVSEVFNEIILLIIFRKEFSIRWIGWWSLIISDHIIMLTITSTYLNYCIISFPKH